MTLIRETFGIRMVGGLGTPPETRRRYHAADLQSLWEGKHFYQTILTKQSKKSKSILTDLKGVVGPCMPAQGRVCERTSSIDFPAGKNMYMTKFPPHLDRFSNSMTVQDRKQEGCQIDLRDYLYVLD